MKPSKRHLLAFGLATYLATLIMTFPADRAYGWLRPALGTNVPVRLYGVNGTIWSGTANQAQVYGRAVTDLHWGLHPLALFLGRLDVALNAPLSGGHVSGTLSRPWTGKGLSIDTPHIDLPLASLLDAKRFPVPVKGRLTGELTRIDIADNGDFKVDTGDLLIRDLAIEQPSLLPLGGFKVRIEHDAKRALVVKVRDTGGPLTLNATITLPNKDRYTLVAELSAKDKGNAMLRQTLGLIGAPDQAGKYRLQRQGSIKQDLALFRL